MISSNTFTFLEELSANNNREWFQFQKAEYESAREDILAFVAEVIAELSQIDPLIPASLEPRSCVMRIYRDVRFSRDKTPYKTNFGIGISHFAKNFDGPGYYLHIGADECFLAAGCWMPDPDKLRSIRQEIDYNGYEFTEIVEHPEFVNYFGTPDQEHILKTNPKGYDGNHPLINYLKLKSFTFSKNLDPKLLVSSHAIKVVSEGFKRVYPFMVFLRNALA